MFGGNFTELIGHARATGDPVDQTLGLGQNPLEHGFRPAHFPEYIDMKTALSPGNLMGIAHLGNPAVDGVFNQFLMAIDSGLAMVYLGNDITRVIIAVRIDTGNGPNPTGSSPGP